MNTTNLHHNTVSFLTLVSDYGIIFTAIFLFHNYGSLWLYPLLAWIIGAKQYSIGESLLHEASHYQLFSSKKLNNYLDLILAWPFLTSIAYYREGHLKHHQYLGTEKDPLIKHCEKYGIEKYPLWYHWFIRPFIGGFALFTIKNWIQAFSNKKIWGSYVFWILAIGICYFQGWLIFLLIYWLIPLLWSFNSFIFWSEITDHYGCGGESRSYENAFSNFFISHNAGFHWFHHLKPQVPFFLLKKAAIQSNLKASIVSKSLFETYRQIHQFRYKESS